jgi:hypothetical protein
MIVDILTTAGVFILAIIICFAAFVRWGSRWGATAGEQALVMPGDVYLDGDCAGKTRMTRAISIAAPPEIVWPWLAQLGRGAGWYSIDRLDNGGKTSAQHIVSWIPEPQLGDATPIGYLRHLDVGRELVWWASGARFLGATTRLMVDIRLKPEAAGSRLIVRISADAVGMTAHFAIWIFQFIDTIMARRQLLGIKERVECYGVRSADPNQPETGSRDQFQWYEVIYASGGNAGRQGKERAADWHRAAVEAGLPKEVVV